MSPRDRGVRPGRRPGPADVARRKSKDPRRIFWLFAVFTLAAAGLSVRLVYMQVVKADDWAAAAESIRTRELTLSPRRGTIYDREGEVLAASVPATTVYANPREVEDPQAVARRLVELFGGDYDFYLGRLTRDSGFSYLVRKADAALAETLEEGGFDGVYFLPDSRRVYPNGELAGQVLGYVDIDDVGRSGIELYYDEVLSGTPGELLVERGEGGLPIPGGVKNEIAAVDGDDLVLSIDKDIQAFAQSAIASATAEWDATSGTVVVMDPRSGEVYAMASSRAFDPNTYNTADLTAVPNRAVTDAFEPGSTFKAITAAAVFDRGVFARDTAFTLPYSIQVYDQTIRDSSPRGTVTYTFEDIIVHSSNVGTVKLAEGLGGRALYDYVVAFGLTQKPGIDLPGATKGLLADFDDWYRTTYANLSFGQGISVSALQLARAVSGIANEGVVPTPHLLIDTPGKEFARTWPTQRAIGIAAAKQTTDVLVQAAGKGTRNQVEVPGYVVAGKTGTAQKAGEPGQGYIAGAYVSSFIGYLPAENPRLLVYVILDEPRNAYYGVTVATPTFNKVATFAAEHLRIPPSPVVETEDAAADVTAP